MIRGFCSKQLNQLPHCGLGIRNGNQKRTVSLVLTGSGLIPKGVFTSLERCVETFWHVHAFLYVSERFNTVPSDASLQKQTRAKSVGIVHAFHLCVFKRLASVPTLLLAPIRLLKLRVLKRACDCVPQLVLNLFQRASYMDDEEYTLPEITPI